MTHEDLLDIARTIVRGFMSATHKYLLLLSLMLVGCGHTTYVYGVMPDACKGNIDSVVIAVVDAPDPLDIQKLVFWCRDGSKEAYWPIVAINK